MTKLPEDLERLLDEERGRIELSPDALASEWMALQKSIRKVAAGAPADAPPPTAQSPGGATASGASGILSRTAHALWAGTAAVAFGTGVLVGRSTAPLPPPPAPVVASVTPSAGQSAPAPSTTAAPVVPVPVAPSPHPPTLAPSIATKSGVAPAASSAPAGTSTLPEERALVEGARTAMLRGRAGDALALAERHRTSFPDGELAEDRDFLILSALRDLGRIEESRAKATAFVARYPKSPLRGAALAIARGGQPITE